MSDPSTDPADHADVILLRAHGGMLMRPRVAMVGMPLADYPLLARSLRQQGMLEAVRVLQSLDPPLDPDELRRAAYAVKDAAVALKVTP